MAGQVRPVGVGSHLAVPPAEALIAEVGVDVVVSAEARGPRHAVLVLGWDRVEDRRHALRPLGVLPALVGQLALDPLVGVERIGQGAGRVVRLPVGVLRGEPGGVGEADEDRGVALDQLDPRGLQQESVGQNAVVRQLGQGGADDALPLREP